jgi:ribosome-binding protein aMBF1 (putative translation factor)
MEAPRTMTPAEAAVKNHKQEIRKAIRRGWSSKDIAKSLSVSLRTLQKYMRDEGIFFRAPRSEYSRLKLARIQRNKLARSKTK